MMTVSLEESRLDLLNAESVMAQIDAAQIDLLFDRPPFGRERSSRREERRRRRRRAAFHLLLFPAPGQVRGVGAEGGAALPEPAHPGRAQRSF